MVPHGGWKTKAGTKPGPGIRCRRQPPQRPQPRYSSLSPDPSIASPATKGCENNWAPWGLWYHPCVLALLVFLVILCLAVLALPVIAAAAAAIVVLGLIGKGLELLVESRA